MFTKATKEQARLRMAIHGPAGAGKTYSALSIAKHLGTKIAVIDTEKGSASKYSNDFDFDVCPISAPYHPNKCMEAMKFAADAGYDMIVIDSITHFWNELGGFLDLVEEEVKKMKARGGKPDSFAAWRFVDPIYRNLIASILSSPAHVIVTMRAKTEYDRSENSNGKAQLKKVGLAPVFRAEGQYEFDIEGMLSAEHDLVIGKTRCSAIDEKVFNKPGKEFAEIVKHWLEDGVPTVKVETAGPTVAKATIASVPTNEDILAVIATVTDKATFDQAKDLYVANKALFPTEVVQGQYRALKAKQEELKQSA